MRAATTPVHVEHGRVRIGPVGPDACPECLVHRRSRARLHDARPDLEPPVETDTSLLTGAARQVVRVVTDAAPTAAEAVERYWLVDLVTLEVMSHQYLPDPDCVRCGGLPADARPTSLPRDVPSPSKLAPDVARTAVAADRLPTWERLYVDGDAGLVRSLNPATIGRTVVCGAPLRVRGQDLFEPGFGRSPSFVESRTTALLEALERYGSATPGRRRTVVSAAWSDVSDVAVDPRSLGLPAVSGPGARYRTWTPDSVLHWVWGWSLTHDGPRLVPEEAVFYDVAPAAGTRRVLGEVGSGSAVGSCLEEAAVHALWELVERDAFMVTWLARLPAPELDVHALGDPELAMAVAAVRVETGFDVRVLDTTMEHGLPSTWAVATAADPDVEPRLVCAAGAAPTRAAAALRAVREVGPMVHVVRDHFGAHAALARDLVRDPSRVTEMTHHYLVNATTEGARRLDFLLDGAAGPPRADPGGFTGARIGDDLSTMVGMLAAVDLEVVLVDQTPPELEAGGLSCVRALVPGLVPLTFGHDRRRTVGLGRVREAPVLLGHATTPLREEEVHQNPHPFP